jgi:glycogen synthase
VRVLLVPNTYLPKVGGVEEVTRQLARELRRRAHEVAVLTNRWQGVGSRDEVEGVEVRRVRLPLPGVAGRVRFALAAPVAAATFLASVRRFGPNVVHVVAAGPAVVYLAALRRLVGAPIVLTSQGEVGIAPHRIFQRSRALRWGLQRLLADAAAVTACSRFVLEELRSEFDVTAPAEVVPNGFDPSELEVAPADEPRYVFAAGRLVEQKGFDVLLHAFASGGKGLQLLIAGEGRERGRLEGLTRELGLEGRVRWLGVAGRERLAALINGAEAVAVPSRQEPFGVILLEAMAAGRPTVASRVGGIPEFAEDGVTTLLVPPEDPGALAEALARLTADAELRNRLGENGKERAADYAWTRIADRYAAVYLRVQ